MNDFYRRMKLKAYFWKKTKAEEQKEVYFSKTLTNQNHNTIKTLIEATIKEIEDDLKNKTVIACKYINLTQKEQKALGGLKHRQDIVITNTGKGEQ